MVGNIIGRDLEVWHPIPRYDRWVESLGIPVHRGYYVEDLRTMPLGPWEERECNAAVLILEGQEGLTESRVTEIPAGATLPPLKLAIDELVYVLSGRGLTTVWAEGHPKKTFEWQAHSLFLLPRNYTHQLTNAQGNEPVRVLNFNYLPLAMAVFQDPKYFFNNPYLQPDPEVLYRPDTDFYLSEARKVTMGEGIGVIWVGNFLPDMGAWDKLRGQSERGIGSMSACFVFPGTGMSVSTPTMPVGTYKKAHRHGPGVVITIPREADGYSIMWPEGGEKVIIPWHEGSMFIPPNQWYHQHFNVDSTPARYMSLFPPRSHLFGPTRGYYRRLGQREARRQLEYTDEEPWIRERFEQELENRGLKSLMPEEAYQNADFKLPRDAGDD